MTPTEMIATAIQRERNAAGLSLSALAARAGIAKSTLSQLEAGKGNPSIETLWSLATALNVPFSCLFETPKQVTTLIRATEGTALKSEQANISAVLLSAGYPASRRDLYRMALEPGEARHSEAHSQGTVEHAIICTGRALLGPEDRLVEIGPGDYYSYPGDVAHRYQGMDSGTVLVLVMQHRS